MPEPTENNSDEQKKAAAFLTRPKIPFERDILFTRTARDIKDSTFKIVFNTAAGVGAFDRINNALKPHWVKHDDEEDRVYLSPTIETKTIGGSLLSSVGPGWGSTFDEVAIAFEKTLLQKASKPGTLIVVDAFMSSRKEYTYSPAANKFCPYSKPKPNQ